MIMTNKLLPVALVAALIGGSVGAFVMHSRNTTPAESQTATSTQPVDATLASTSGGEQFIPAQFNSPAEQTAYKSGFADGFNAADSNTADVNSTSGVQSNQRVVYRNTGRSVARNSTSSRRVYYDYQQPKGRSFWQKHRDKLTVAAGTGGGAIIGGLIGGKKGAAIGALSGAGGSALYTYKLRKRNRNY